MTFTQAQMWDRRIERAEWLWATSGELGKIIDSDEAFELVMQTRTHAVADAVSITWGIADRVLEFADASRLLLIAADANTAAGDSRVIQPDETTSVASVGGRSILRDGSPYVHGTTHYSWSAFPRHDSF